jgi:hypothetical protein
MGDLVIARDQVIGPAKSRNRATSPRSENKSLQLIMFHLLRYCKIAGEGACAPHPFKQKKRPLFFAAS